MAALKYPRVLLKLSGEALQDRKQGENLSPRILAAVAQQRSACPRSASSGFMAPLE